MLNLVIVQDKTVDRMYYNRLVMLSLIFRSIDAVVNCFVLYFNNVVNQSKYDCVFETCHNRLNVYVVNTVSSNDYNCLTMNECTVQTLSKEINHRI